ncbi:MAG: VOC family protein [Dyadobacter sp.]|uniref:VOC family protein n=1 Tax=Dyadobacter sp. TaxID=1914288 RepID=UPI003262DBAF
MKIEMVSVYVSDVNKAFKYYTEVLGFVEKMYVPEAMIAIVASPADPQGTSLMLEPNENPIASSYQKQLYEANIPIMTFSAEDIYDEHSKLVAAGVKFRKDPKKTDWGIEAIFEDTFGNLIQLASLS